MDLIDTHAHLDLPEFQGDLDDVISRAQAAGMKYIITVGIDLDSSQRAVNIARQYRTVYAAVGIHPHESKKVTDSDWVVLERLLNEPKVVALGEIGLDFYKDYSPRETQKTVFQKQLTMAQQYHKPIILHCREAHQDCLEILNGLMSERVYGVAHCFSGSVTFARQYWEMGLYLSFAGPVTFPTAFRLREVVKSVGVERLLLETDSPFLAPQPKRGQRNEPAYLIYCLAELARIYGRPDQEIAHITTLNAQRLFGLGTP